MHQLKMYLFGSPRIEIGGQRAEISLRKSQAILSYLAYTKQSFSREALAALFWPDDDNRKALANLRRALYSINHSTQEEILLVTRKSVELNRKVELWLDTDEFCQIVTPCFKDYPPTGELDDECAASLSGAVELFADDFLAGFTLPDSPSFDEWQFFQAESLRQVKAQALERLVVTYQAKGLGYDAIRYARSWIALDPLYEPPNRILIELYSLTGQYAAAVRQYETFRRLLADELGVNPEPETTALYEMIRGRQKVHEQKHDWTPADGLSEINPSQTYQKKNTYKITFHNLLVHPNVFVGRKVELSNIRHLLTDDPACRLLTLLGPSGIGKTRLAMEAANRIIHTFSDGILFLPLGSLSPSGHLLEALAEMIGLPSYKDAYAKQQLFRYLAGKHMMLILDDFDHLIHESGLVAEILSSAPGVKVLVTASERLNLNGEMVYVLGGMQYPPRDVDVSLQDFGGVQLLQQSARLVRPHANFSDEDYQEMGRISRLVQGMPLALVLAAAWYEMLSFKEIADEIEKSLDFLEGSTYDVPDRQRSVRAAFEYSWRRLSKSDQNAFMRLTIFQGGFSRDAAHRVIGTELRTLRQLIDKSLIFLRRDGRYEIHELLRKYGAEQLAESGQFASIQDAHSEYYLGVLAQWEADIKGRRQIDTLVAIENDLENIRSAWYWALERMNEGVINRSVEALHLFFSFRNWYREGAKLLQIAMEKLEPAGEDCSSPAYRRVLSRLAWHQSLGTTKHIDFDRKLKFCLQLAEEEHNQEEIAFILLQLGCHNIFIKRDPANALEYLNKSLKLYLALDDKFYIAIVLHWLGFCHGFVTGARMMIRFTQQSLDLAKESGNGVLIPDNMRNLAMGELCTGNYTAAERWCKEALAIDSRLGVHMGTAESKTLLSLIHFFRGDLDASCDLAEEAIEMSRAVGYQTSLANALAALSLSAAVKGDLGKSERLAQESLAGNSTNFGIILGNWGLAITYASKGMSELAWQSLLLAMEYAGSLLSDAIVAWMFPVAALLLAQSTFPGIAVEIVSTIENHPLSPAWIVQWDNYQAAIDCLRNERCGVAFDAAWERGKTTEIRDILEFLQTAKQVA